VFKIGVDKEEVVIDEGYQNVIRKIQQFRPHKTTIRAVVYHSLDFWLDDLVRRDKEDREDNKKKEHDYEIRKTET